MKQEEFIKRFTYDPTSDLLGEGGFGRVYKAYDNYEHEYVALKIQDVDPRYPELRLKNEVEKVQRHLHKNVARYKGCFTMVDYRGETDVAIMKYYNDGSLDKLLAHGKLSHAEKCELLVEILEGIAYLHSEGIIHRDLKPQNVLIVQHEGRYWPLITDFGISKQLDEGQSSAVSNSVLGGTRAYASPEQLKERTIRKNTDLWSFGVIAFQMLVGKLPFDCGKYSATSEEGRQEQFRQMMSGLLPEAVATIPEPWQRLIRECLTVDNERRIAHAEDCLAIIRGEEATAVAIEVDNPTTQLDGDSETAVEPEPQPEPKPEPQPEPQPEPKVAPKVTPKQEQKPVSTPKPKKKSKLWLWLLLLAIVGGGVFAYLNSQPKDNPEPTPTPDPVLCLTSNSRDTVEHGGGNGTIRYTLENPVSGVNLSVIDDASWLTTSRSDNTISYSASANESQSSRTATITVSYGGQSFEVAITQSCGNYTEYMGEDGIGMNMVWVEGGTFQMGSTNGDSDEQPVHPVTLSDYWIAETEVTQAQWEAVMGTTVRQQRDDTSWLLRGEGSNYPMYYVSYTDALEFCRRLSSATGKRYTLPTEAQWEYAALGGQRANGTMFTYSGSNAIGNVAWYEDNSSGQTHPVKQKAANQLGLYDMSGNVYEWCLDWYSSSYYSSSPQNNPQGPSSGQDRVLRGGCLYYPASICRVASRTDCSPSHRGDIIGFRVVCLP